MNFPEDFLDLVNTDSKAFLYLATLMPDGSPQVTPVWFDSDGEHILINTAEGRIKDKNMRARPKVAMTIQDPNDKYRYLGIRVKWPVIRRKAEMNTSTNSPSNTTTHRGNFAKGKRALSLRLSPPAL